MAHSASTARSSAPSNDSQDTSIGALVQSAMADVSTLVRNEVELAKSEIGRSAKKAGISVALFAVAGVLMAFAGIYLFVAIAEGIAEGLPRWLSYLIVTVFLFLVAAVVGLVGFRMLKKIDKPERTIESLKDLPDVMRREAPGLRRRDLPTVSNGHVERRSPDTYLV